MIGTEVPKQTSDSHREQCSICHEHVEASTPGGITESWASLYCGHKFGSTCIQTWFQEVLNRDDYYRADPTCPICRETARHPVCGHLVYNSPILSTHQYLTDQYHVTTIIETRSSHERHMHRLWRDSVRRRGEDPNRTLIMMTRRVADTVGECSVCAGMGARGYGSERD
jgi:hypothetical protein